MVSEGHIYVLVPMFCVVQWLDYLTGDQKVTGSIPVRDSEVFLREELESVRIKNIKTTKLLQLHHW